MLKILEIEEEIANLSKIWLKEYFETLIKNANIVQNTPLIKKKKLKTLISVLVTFAFVTNSDKTDKIFDHILYIVYLLHVLKIFDKVDRYISFCVNLML